MRGLLLLDDRSYVHLQLADMRLAAIFDERDIQEQIAVPVPRVIELVLGAHDAQPGGVILHGGELVELRQRDGGVATASRNLVSSLSSRSSVQECMSVVLDASRFLSILCGIRLFHFFVNHQGFSFSQRNLAEGRDAHVTKDDTARAPQSSTHQFSRTKGSTKSAGA